MSQLKSSRDSLSAAWFLGAVGFILVATLPPRPEWQGADRQIFSLLPRTWAGWFDVTQNLALYIPLGLALAARGYSPLRVSGASGFLSLATELLQFMIPGRSPSAPDVVANTAGALLGSLLWSSPLGDATALLLNGIERWFVRARSSDWRYASILSLAWALGVAAVLVATAALLRPAPPRFGYWVASPNIDREPGPLRIGSNDAQSGWFRGLIDEVRIFNRARPAERIREDMWSSAAAPPISEDLVAAFSFDANGGALARDDSAHGHDGVVHGATWTPSGRLGGAMSFDGESSLVEVPHRPSLDLRDAMTLEAWVRPSAESVGEPGIVARDGNSYYIEESSALGRFHSAGGGRFGGVPRYARLPEPITPDLWTHLATTYDGQVIRLYVNGELAATQVHWSLHRPERALLNGVNLPPGKVTDLDALRRALLGNVSLDVAVRCGGFSGTSAPVFLIGGLQNKQVLALNATGTDLVVWTWTWARALSLSSPPVLVSNALGVCAPGRTVALALNGRLQNPTIVRDGQRLSAAIPGLGSAWAFVFHSDVLPGWLQVAATCAWLALLAAPLGFWARPTAIAAASLVLVAGACLTLPYILHVRPLNPSEVGAIFAGGTFGISLHLRGRLLPFRPGRSDKCR